MLKWLTRYLDNKKKEKEIIRKNHEKQEHFQKRVMETIKEGCQYNKNKNQRKIKSNGRQFFFDSNIYSSIFENGK